MGRQPTNNNLPDIIQKLRKATKLIKANEELLLNPDLKLLPDYNDLAITMISDVLPIFYIGGQNYLHNHKYRELALWKIYADYRRKHAGNHIHGGDINAQIKAECKSMTAKGDKLRISAETQIGQIDKVYNKVGDADEKYCLQTEYSLVCGIFTATDAMPIIVFYVAAADFGAVIQPLLTTANTSLQQASANLTKASRDSLTLKLKDFLPCKSLDAIYVDRKLLPLAIDPNLKNQLDPKSPLARAFTIHGL